MERKELERQNVISMFRYSTSEEIEKIEGKGKKRFEKLFSGYSDEIERISTSKSLYNSILQHNAGIQKLDLCLQISS